LGISSIENLILYLSIIFFISGIVKGIIGMGLPTISLLLLSLFLDINTAIILIIIPSLITNILQGFYGKYLKELITEYWSFFLISGFFVYFGTMFFEALNLTTTTLLLSLVIIFYSLFALSGKVFSSDKINNPFIKSVVFSSNGFFTGITGSLIFPGVFFFQALQFNREKLIQALGIHFTLLTLFLGLSKFYFHSFLTLKFSHLSIISCIAAFTGMFLGNLISMKIEENLFKRLFLYSLIVIGFLLTIKVLIL
jgi:hypothetical protein